MIFESLNLKISSVLIQETEDSEGESIFFGKPEELKIQIMWMQMEKPASTNKNHLPFGT